VTGVAGQGLEGKEIEGRDIIDLIAVAILSHYRHENRVLETRPKGQLPS